MKKLLSKKVIWVIGIAIIALAIGTSIVIFIFNSKPIPKPPVPENVKFDIKTRHIEYEPYSRHKSMLWPGEDVTAWVRIRITDVKQVKHYVDTSKGFHFYGYDYPSDTLKDDKGRYTLENESKFEVIELIHGAEIKKEHLLYTDIGGEEDIQKGHELVLPIYENHHECYERGARGYVSMRYKFFVDENNKIATANENFNLEVEEYVGMDVEDFVNDIKEDCNKED